MGVPGPVPVARRAFHARYPFLPGAEDALGGLAPTSLELVGGPVHGMARALGRERVRWALRPRGAAASEVGVGDVDDMARILSFQYAALLVSLLPGDGPARRWARSEGEALEATLRDPLTAPEEVASVAQGLGEDVPAERGARGEEVWPMPLARYLTWAPSIRERTFRLVHQPLRRGVITLSRDRFARVLGQCLQETLADRLPLALEPALKEALLQRESPFVREALALLPAREGPRSGPVDPGRFPPCMTALKDGLARGENVGHLGRFALASFLHKVGMDPEGMVDVFRGAPNFNEAITRYQVDQIRRHDGGEGYTPPECASLITAGLCRREADTSPARLCSDPTLLKHPLNYYRRRRREGRGPSPATRTEAAGGPARSGAPGTPP
jgi:DNA primase large subunit